MVKNCCFPSVTLQKSSKRREDDNRGNSFWHAEITKGLNSEPIKLSVTSENIWAPYSTYLLTEAKTNFRYCQAQYATTKCFFHNKHSVLLFFHSNKEKYLLILFSSFIKTFLWLLDLAPKLLRQIHFPSNNENIQVSKLRYVLDWLAIFHFIRTSLSAVGFVNESVNPLNFILKGLQPRCERLTTDLFWCYIGAYKYI